MTKEEFEIIIKPLSLLSAPDRVFMQGVLLGNFINWEKEKQLTLTSVIPQLLCVFDEFASLTIGKKYKLITEDKSCYLLIGDDDKEEWYTKTRFEEVPAQ